MTNTTRLTKAAIEAHPDVPIITITRDFQATPEAVVRAHVDPELFVRWVGPEGLESTVVTWDARSGGEWRYTSRHGDAEFGFRGCFHEVSERRIVQTFTFEGMPESVALETLEVEDLGDGWSRLTASSLVDSFEGRDAWLASGMEVGVDQGYAKLDRLFDEA